MNTPPNIHRRSVGLSIFTSFALTFTVAVHAASNHEAALAVANSLSTERMFSDLNALQAIADESGGNRAAGHPGFEASAAYVEKELQAAGYRSWRQTFNYPIAKVESRLSLVNSEGREFPTTQLFGTSTPEAGVLGNLVLPQGANTCDGAEWTDPNAHGGIGLVQYSDGCNPVELAQNAAKAGIVGLVIYPASFSNWGVQLDVPIIGLIDEADGRYLTELATQQETPVYYLARFSTEYGQTFNVLAETDSGDDDAVVMLGVHLDSVAIGPGMNDNASGAVALLEIARQIKGKSLRNKLRFAWWGAEESGLVGSKHYVHDLADNDKPSLRAIRAYVNADMLASPNYIIGHYDPATEEQTSAIPDSSWKISRLLSTFFHSQQQASVGIDIRGGSDHRSFLDCGVAAGGVGSSNGIYKTEKEAILFGGVAGEPYDPNYHQASDRVAELNVVAQNTFARAMAYAGARLAMDNPLKPGTGTCGNDTAPNLASTPARTGRS